MSSDIENSLESILSSEQPTLLDHLQNQFHRFLIAGIILIVVVLGYGALVQYNDEANQLNGEKLSSIKTVEELDAFIQSHAGTTFAANAQIQKADLLWQTSKKEDAILVLQDFVKNQSQHPLYVENLLGLASKLEKMGKIDEAKAIFEQVVKQHRTHSLAPLAAMRIVDQLWNAGQDEAALKGFEEVKVTHSTMNKMLMELLERRITLVKAKLPKTEVDNPAVPAAAIPGLNPLPAGPTNLPGIVNPLNK
jgi:predicted negative regulator of RcsB-dependent stress response